MNRGPVMIVWRRAPELAGALVLAGLLGGGSHAGASEPIVPKGDMSALREAERILVRVTVRGPEGPQEASELIRTVSRRLSEVGFHVVRDARDAHDVQVKVRCELGPGDAGRDGAASAKSASRRGPRVGAPCVIGYSVRGVTPGWRRLNHVVHNFGVEAARSLLLQGGALTPRQVFARFLSYLDFPVLLAAEWAQVDRLLGLLESRDTDLPRRKRIIFLLGEIHAGAAMPCLVQALDDDEVVRDAALALGHFGTEARPALIRLLRRSPRADVQAAAARSLGRIGASTGDWSLTPLFVEMLESPGLHIAVQTELVLAIGKNPDRRALPVLERLAEEAWKRRSHDARLDDLRRALDWSHRSVRLGGHGDQY